MKRQDIQVFSKDWFKLHQSKLVWFANTRYGRDLMGFNTDLPVSEVYPNGVICDLGNNKYFFELRTHDKIGKRLYHNLKPFWQAMHWFDMNIANKVDYRMNLGFDTFGPFYPDANPETNSADGQVYRHNVNQTFTDIINGAGTGFSDSSATLTVARITTSTTTNQFARIDRSIFMFDTSSIGSGNQIDSATFSLWILSATNQFVANAIDVVATSPASNSAIAAADYSTFGSTSFGQISSSPTIGGYNDVSLNASGLANITVTGTSKFGCRYDWDTTETFGDTWASDDFNATSGSFAETTGTTQDPKLTGTFSAAATRDRLMIIS